LKDNYLSNRNDVKASSHDLFEDIVKLTGKHEKDNVNADGGPGLYHKHSPISAVMYKI
jgi:hypothetical protein